MARGKYTTEAILEEGEIGGTVNEYTTIDFTKENSQGKPLAGAKFTIYQSNAKQEKGALATNKDNQTLENLVSNEEGKLCLVGADGTLSPVSLSLKRGYYLVSEIEAPKGYEKGGDVFFTVGYKADSIVFKNSSTPTPEPSPTPTSSIKETSSTITKETTNTGTKSTSTATKSTTINPTNTSNPTKAESSITESGTKLPKTGEDLSAIAWAIPSLLACALFLLVLRHKIKD